VVTAQSLFQKSQAVLPSLGGKGNGSSTLRVRGGVRGTHPAVTFTVSLGIFLLEASFRRQSSSGEKKGFFYFTSSFLESPKP
jgi:hypothetical protein